MRTLVTFVAMLLLLLFAVGEQPIAKETPDGWDNPTSTHPWGGDETPDEPGDGSTGDRPTVSDRTANTISMSGIWYLDFLFNRFVNEPMLESRDSYRTVSKATIKYRKTDSKNRQR